MKLKKKNEPARDENEMAQFRSHGSLLLVYSSATFSWTSPLSERKVPIVLHLGIPGIDAKRPCIFALIPRRVSCASCCRPRKLELKSKNEAGEEGKETLNSAGSIP